ncbi:MAG: response regulator [Pseudomonadota bacterium]|nr:response regulator [Pseudomonadota bacterium]MDQ3160449.1 response regulator [Pseudomonadota bacterium]
MNDPNPASLPRILLVEDDPISAAYLAEVLTSLPAQVDVAGSVAKALTITGIHRHALLLIDAHLPDGRGASLLQALRAQGVMAPALAHTAAAEASLRDELLAAGFVEVLHKPLGMLELTQALRRHLPQVLAPPGTSVTPPCWDDAAALAALGGQRANVDALRGLFVEELPGQRHRITRACIERNGTAVLDELHRLVASCGFVGAARLGHVVRVMQATPLDQDSLSALQSAIEGVLTSDWARGR